MTHRPHPERICGLLLVVMASACGFNPVPEVSLDPAPRGSFEEGDLLHLSFSEAVNPATLRVAIWFEERDVERRFPAGSKPQVSLCTPALSPCACDDRDCGAVDLIMDSDNLGATLALDPKGLGQPDIPLILEVLPGLSDRSGRATGPSHFFDFQFKPKPERCDLDVPFDNGEYVIVGVTNDPLPVTLTLLTDIEVLSDGRLALVAAEGDEVPGAAKNTLKASELFVDTTDQGFVVFARGKARACTTGERFLETQAITVTLRIGPVTVTLVDFRLSGKILVDPETGSDRLEGTLSWSGLSLDLGTGEPTAYTAATTTFTGLKVPEGQEFSDLPRLCGDLCGGVPDQCNPPEGFPGAGFCAGGSK